LLLGTFPRTKRSKDEHCGGTSELEPKALCHVFIIPHSLHSKKFRHENVTGYKIWCVFLTCHHSAFTYYSEASSSNQNISRDLHVDIFIFLKIFSLKTLRILHRLITIWNFKSLHWMGLMSLPHNFASPPCSYWWMTWSESAQRWGSRQWHDVHTELRETYFSVYPM